MRDFFRWACYPLGYPIPFYIGFVATDLVAVRTLWYELVFVQIIVFYGRFGFDRMVLLFKQAVNDDQTFSSYGKRTLQIAPAERRT